MFFLPPSLFDSIAREASFIYTEAEIQDRIRREDRGCECYADLSYCRRFEGDGEVDWCALVYCYKSMADSCTGSQWGVYVRAERACGFVGFWDESWVTSPTSPRSFWSNLYRRVEKQCGSIDAYDYSPEMIARRREDREGKKGDRRKREGE